VSTTKTRSITSGITSAGLLSELRILPTALFAARRPQRMIERSFMVFRRGAIVLVSGFFEPLFYLLSIRIGFASLIGTVTVGGRTLGYAEFVAPALMASSAMNGAIYDSTMNVFFKLKHARLYDAVLATPMAAADVALGEIGWAVLRGAVYSVAFLVSMAALGMTRSAWVLLAVPVCVLIAFAFAAVGMAVTTYMRSWADFEYVPTVTLPLFLFSATFYPLASYGRWAWVVQFSPLYHGVALVRALNFGDRSWAMVGHVGVLTALALAGLAVASRRIESLLLT
jgi:lipooligosaccharide transport system permease protein